MAAYAAAATGLAFPAPPVDALTDLVARARAGDDLAFQQLVTTWQRRVLNTVARILGRPDDAEDVAQEVFVRLYFSLDKLREPAQFQPWLYRLITNASIDYLRRHKRSRLRMSDLSDQQVFAADSAQALSRAAEDDQRQRMRDHAEHVLSAVPVKDRMLLTLKEVEGLSVKELCSIYNVSEESIKVRLFRARKRILKSLAERGEAVTLPGQ